MYPIRQKAAWIGGPSAISDDFRFPPLLGAERTSVGQRAI
jgi:hypothetical protein